MLTEQIPPAVVDVFRTHGVIKVYLFGSALTRDFNENSDVDLLVTFNDVPLLDFADNFFDLQEELELILGRRVDLVIEKDLRNPYLIANINRTKRLFYDRSSQEVAVRRANVH
ncbi:MAG: nucleotidyltransferase domain-containing protein [Cytophagaceae bacterium]|nr:nucleotidyltransferase domain-containing protein [Cytophagaceae bacterium]